MTKAHLVGAAIAGLVADTGEDIIDTAYLTDGRNPPTFVVGDGSQRLAYYHQPVGPDKRIEGIALLSTDSQIRYENNSAYVRVHVNLGKKAGETRLQILGLSAEGIAATGGQTPLEQAQTAAAYPDNTKLSTLRANPTNPPSLAVQVDGPFAYINPSTGAFGFYFTNVFSFSGDIPGAGLHRLALLYLDPVAGTLGRVLGGTATASGTLGINATRSEFVTSDYTALAISYFIPIAYVYLYNGQTTIVEADIRRVYEPRLLFANPLPILSGVAKLATLPGIDMNTGTPTTLYTVPTGRSCIIDHVVVRNASTSLTTASYSFGFTSAAFNDVIADATHTELTGNTLYTSLYAKVGAKVGVAAATFKVLMNTLQGGAAMTTMDVFGYLI